MIIIKIQGGLGNQMFQYAYGKHLSYKYNIELRFDIRFYEFNKKREFLLDRFPNTFPITDIYTPLIGPLYTVTDDFNYTELSNLDTCNYYLDGYWQSEKYFKESEGLIREHFQPSKETIEKMSKVPFIDTNTLSIHIRRTDYITSNGYHPVQTIDYYKNAIDIIGDYDNLLVFSDDIKWCRENLNFKNMIFMEGFSEIDDMFIMSMCKNNIISNSTFSWWSAWLNKNPNKKVIAPNKWFGDHVKLDTSNLIPKSWIKI